MPFTYNTDVSTFMQYSVQLNIINVMLVKDSNQLSLLSGSRRQSLKRRSCAPDFDLLNPKSVGCDILSRTITVSSKSLGVKVRGFHFVMLTYRYPHIYPSTHHTHGDKVITISAPIIK